MRTPRFPAEWEKQAALILAMPHSGTHWCKYLKKSQDKITEIALQVARFQPVIVMYKNNADIKNLVQKNNIFPIKITLNDTWCRDFMPLSLVNRDSKKIILLNFIFNGWGLKYSANLDNQASKLLFSSGIFSHIFPNVPQKNIILKSKNFILEGGSIDINGNSIALSTTKCLLEENRNVLSLEKIENKLKKYLKLKKILWLKNGVIKGDDTDSHIDNLARFIDKNTICYLKCYDKKNRHFRELSLMEEELKAFKNLNGKPFSLIPLPMPQKAVIYNKMELPASYVNFLFINNALLVPVFGDKNDGMAINILQNALKDREIIPIDSRILIRQGGGIHCLSMQIPAI